MGSSRLPGKVLLELKDGKSVLDYVINQLGFCETIEKIVVATTTLTEDDKIVEFCKNNNIEYTQNDIKQPNRNKLLGINRGVDGLKTAYTKASGWGIATSALRDNRRITVVINGTNSSRSRMNEATNLINWAFSQTNQILNGKKIE